MPAMWTLRPGHCKILEHIGMWITSTLSPVLYFCKCCENFMVFGWYEGREAHIDPGLVASQGGADVGIVYVGCGPLVGGIQCVNAGDCCAQAVPCDHHLHSHSSLWPCNGERNGTRSHQIGADSANARLPVEQKQNQLHDLQQPPPIQHK